MGILAPVVAVVMAFVVSGLIILIFITSYGLSDASLDGLKERGLPAEILDRLQPIKGNEFTQRGVFEEALVSAIGETDYAQYGSIISKQAFSRENPVRVYNEIFKAALKDRNGWGNVLYRATPLILTGLAVAFAFQCGLFNIGGEGQMVMGGFALTWVGFTITGLPWYLLMPLCVLAAILAGAFWGGHSGVSKSHPGRTRGGDHHHAQLDRGGPGPIFNNGLQTPGFLDPAYL